MFKPHPWWFILHWPAGGCGLLAWKDSNGPTAHMPALYLHRDQTEAKQLPGAIKHCASVQTWLVAHSSLLSVCAVKPVWLWGLYDILCDRTSEQYIKSSHSSFYYKPCVMNTQIEHPIFVLEQKRLMFCSGYMIKCSSIEVWNLNQFFGELML